MENSYIFLSLVSGGLQIIGYLIYISDDHIEPNPLTWLMFAYGTTILTVLEYSRGASVHELILPGTCAIMGIYVAVRCWVKILSSRGVTMSTAVFTTVIDKVSFFGDVAITLLYVCAWLLTISGNISASALSVSILVFLICSNATTITSFIPIIRSTYQEPHHERATAWVVWTAAYSTLAVLTTMKHGFWSELNIYPVSCMFLHGLVAWLARPSRMQATRL